MSNSESRKRLAEQQPTARDALRALAAAATPGPWRFTDAEVVNDVWDAGLVIVDADQTAIAALHDEWYEPDDDELACVDDAAYIAAASPDRITALLDDLDAAERERDAAQATATEVTRQLGLHADRDALRALAAGIKTHNSTPVTPENLRYAATHEALCRSWIFDVLTGLADALDTPAPATRDADEDRWPCDNYRPPVTCLTAPSSRAGRCDQCSRRTPTEPDADERGALEAACLEGLVATPHGYRYRPSAGADAVLAAGFRRAADAATIADLRDRLAAVEALRATAARSVHGRLSLADDLRRVLAGEGGEG